MRLLWLMCIRSNAGGRILCMALALGCAATGYAAPQASPWERPAAEMAHKIAEVLGPAAVHLDVENLSAIPNDAVPAIRHALEDALKSDGVNLVRIEGAGTIRVTLSENARGGLWIAEMVTGGETRVVMLPLDVNAAPGLAPHQKVLLHRDVLARSSELNWDSSTQRRLSPEQIIAAALIHGDLVVLTTTQAAVFHASAGGWVEEGHADFAVQAMGRDPRGAIAAAADGNGFSAFAPGVECAGTMAAEPEQQPGGDWTLHCHPSDDPWPLMRVGADLWMKGFYNSARNYFTGVVMPPVGVDLPPFYGAALLPGRSGAALLMGGLDGKVRLAENAQLQPIAGTHDWGSDFAVMPSACSTVAQVIVSSSQAGADDDLRAYEVPAQEATAISDPLALPGTVMWLAQAPAAGSVIAILRITRHDQTFDYEVDRVTESCN